eukprot:scaffold13166_cov139-Skeletonema_menzelii.AAC.4
MDGDFFGFLFLLSHRWCIAGSRREKPHPRSSAGRQQSTMTAAFRLLAPILIDTTTRQRLPRHILH